MPQLGDQRFKRRFLFWPLRAGYEVRWFGWANIRQVYAPGYGWRNDGFVDDQLMLGERLLRDADPNHQGPIQRVRHS